MVEIRHFACQLSQDANLVEWEWFPSQRRQISVRAEKIAISDKECAEPVVQGPTLITSSTVARLCFLVSNNRAHADNLRIGITDAGAARMPDVCVNRLHNPSPYDLRHVG